MGKLEVFDGKQSSWEGLWWHSDTNYFSSASISLAQLKKFKGSVRIYVRKNRFYDNGKNGRPNYMFCIRDAKSESVRDLEIEEIEPGNDWQAKNDELRNLVKDMWNGMCPSEAEYDCSKCKHYNGTDCEFVQRIKELGIDVGE